jgi:hypothetical protein
MIPAISIGVMTHLVIVLLEVFFFLNSVTTLEVTYFTCKR